ncbi:MAG: HPP family protein [Aestuariivirga sp.]|uniref:HPP family protein n=1 Tax=Aestuariivirga sp. TaxID=2650926 RepID=UPI003017D552
MTWTGVHAPPRNVSIFRATSSQRLESALVAFFKTFETYLLATAELEQASKAYGGPDRQARDAELRKVRADLHERFGRKCLQPPRLQIAAPAGIGKTSRFIKAYASSPTLHGLHVDYFVPTIERAEKLAAALHKAFKGSGINGSGLVQVMYGRSDPKHGRCHPDRKELVASAENKSRSVHNLLCRSLDPSVEGFSAEVECPFSDWCQAVGYQSQFATSGPKLRIWPHAQLPLTQHEDLRLPEAALVIVDESCVSALCKKGAPLELAELANTANYIDPHGGIDYAALATGNRLRAAIKLERGSVQLQPLIDVQITSDELRHAERSARCAARDRSLVVVADWPAEEIKAKIDDHQYCGAGTVAGILGQLAMAMEAGLLLSTAVSLVAVRQFDSPNGIVVGYKLALSTASPPRVPASAGLLLLDADANAEINRRLFGPKLRHITIRSKRFGYVKQVFSTAFSKYSLTSAGGAGLRAKIVLLVAGYVGRGKKVLVGCSLAVRRALTGETDAKLPQSASWNGAAVTHFGAFVGSNAWEKYDVVVVLGREQPPPLAVVAFEMFAHRKKCAWAMRPLLVPVICCLSATAAFLLVAWLGVGPLAAALSLTCGVVLTRVFKLHFPPAITVGLLPFVMPHLDGRYPAAVTLGAVLLCLAFLLWRKTSAWSLARHRESFSAALRAFSGRGSSAP